jgi:hypothetical protein
MRKGVERKTEKAAFELSSRRDGLRSWSAWVQGAGRRVDFAGKREIGDLACVRPSGVPADVTQDDPSASREGKGKGVQRETGTALCPCVPLVADSLPYLRQWTLKRTPNELEKVSLRKGDYA